jgi:hypothetical protein
VHHRLIERNRVVRDRLTLVQQRIERDFAEPRLCFPGLEFRPAEEWEWVRPSVDPSLIAAKEIDDDYVCISGGHSFRVGSDLGDEEIAVEVASQLQDDAMDRLGALWPSLIVPEGITAVLEPRLSSAGVAVWATKAGYRCPIGRLQDVFGTLHMIG